MNPFAPLRCPLYVHFTSSKHTLHACCVCSKKERNFFMGWRSSSMKHADTAASEMGHIQECDSIISDSGKPQHEGALMRGMTQNKVDTKSNKRHVVSDDDPGSVGHANFPLHCPTDTAAAMRSGASDTGSMGKELLNSTTLPLPSANEPIQNKVNVQRTVSTRVNNPSSKAPTASAANSSGSNPSATNLPGCRPWSMHYRRLVQPPGNAGLQGSAKRINSKVRC